MRKRQGHDRDRTVTVEFPPQLHPTVTRPHSWPAQPVSPAKAPNAMRNGEKTVELITSAWRVGAAHATAMVMWHGLLFCPTWAPVRSASAALATASG